MDTRSKILTLDAARRLPPPLALVTGYFDVLQAEHVRELERVRRPLLVAVVGHSGEVMDAGARAQMVAALRVVDYVVAAYHDDVEVLIQHLKPAELVRLEAADANRVRRLIDDVNRGQSR